MATKKVLSYSAMWNYKKSEGGIGLEISKGKHVTLSVKNPMEILLGLDMLRNEEPVYYNDVEQYIRLGKEPVGTWDSQVGTKSK
ncbi:hypothetical protein [Maribacter sp. HTCC2170]|uniref:hypothetical protein n=1 Tax=Maribacter sp. (strain HTCC2170 / KCCM 42371) TaxID=313603 RepID=UPI00006BD36A|nr:hypothetical protein [Maribacter sp. HTCC2170]EAR03054.1 hypothetical protein FB2170_07185 [Maribacter sp. HTCC2170]